MGTLHQFPVIPRPTPEPKPHDVELIEELCAMKWADMTGDQQTRWWELVRP